MKTLPKVLLSSAAVAAAAMGLSPVAVAARPSPPSPTSLSIGSAALDPSLFPTALQLTYNFASISDSSTNTATPPAIGGSGMTALAELFFEDSTITPSLASGIVNIYGTFTNQSTFPSYVLGFGFRGNTADATYTVNSDSTFNAVTPFNPSLSSFSGITGTAPLSTQGWSFRADSNGQSGNTGALGSVSDSRWPYAFYFDAPNGQPSSNGIGPSSQALFSLTYTGSESAQTLYDYFSRGQGFFRAQAISNEDFPNVASDKVLTGPGGGGGGLDCTDPSLCPTPVPLESDLAGVSAISALGYWAYRRRQKAADAASLTDLS